MTLNDYHAHVSWYYYGTIMVKTNQKHGVTTILISTSKLNARNENSVIITLIIVPNPFLVRNKKEYILKNV